jgi:hypothetical protein
MHPATSWEVVERCKELAVQITTILGLSRRQILKIMSLSSMATSHQSVAHRKYVPYKYLLWIYADLDVGSCKPIQHAGQRPIVVCHANAISRLG